MSELVFQMGNHPAKIPTDRLYAHNHHWLKPLEHQPEAYQVGFTSYSVRLLLDVYFLEWSVDPCSVVKLKQEIGQIESSKAVSSLHAPAEGEILEFNAGVLADPSAINTDGYESGWLYTFRTKETLLTPQEYLDLLSSVWEKTQRLIKGQINQG